MFFDMPKAEAKFQSKLTRFFGTTAASDFLSTLNGGVVALSYEAKAISCPGLVSSRRACSSDLCLRRLAVGGHEEMQADALRQARGDYALKGRPAKAYKISDMSLGIKPFDGFVMGRGCMSGFLVAVSCHASSGARVYMVDPKDWQEALEGKASVNEGELRLFGKAVQLPL